DGKAGWITGVTNEVVRQTIGKSALLGEHSIDWYHKSPKMDLVNTEVRRLSKKEKLNLIKYLKEEIENDTSFEELEKMNRYRDPMNPFNVAPTSTLKPFYRNGVKHEPGIVPHKWTVLKLDAITETYKDAKCFRFRLPRPTDHLGCLPGQYLHVRAISKDGKEVIRPYSPISDPYQFGQLEIFAKLEAGGELSSILKELKVGDTLEFRGPMGGFE